jgi:recombinational DNA repair protein RecR
MNGKIKRVFQRMLENVSKGKIVAYCVEVEGEGKAYYIHNLAKQNCLEIGYHLPRTPLIQTVCQWLEACNSNDK